MRRLAPMLTLALCLALAASRVAAAPSPKPATQNVSESDRIEFLQKNVQAQMQELQERMFRLSELTRAAEPTDAAKLVLALRRSREEMILEEMKEVMDLLGNKNLGHTVVSEQEVIKKLEALKELLLSNDLDLQLALERIKKLQAAVAKLDTAIKEEKRQSARSAELAKATTQPAKALDAHKQDQEQNRKATDAVAQAVKELGDPVTASVPTLSNATGAMSSAEAKIATGKPGDAKSSQEQATAALQKARDELEQQRQEMLAQIEGQVKRQVMENLELMLEKQKTIREADEALLPRLKQENREAGLRLRALATGETHIAELAESTAQLVEDTEFSFALPPNLRNIARRAIYVTSDLTAGKGDEPVIVAEKKIERDLADLIETFKDSSPAANGKSKSSPRNSSKSDKNKLLAELKAIRMLQSRVNEETVELDAHHAAVKALPKQLQDQVGDNRDHQATVRDTLEKLDALVSGKAKTF